MTSVAITTNAPAHFLSAEQIGRTPRLSRLIESTGITDVLCLNSLRARAKMLAEQAAAATKDEHERPEASSAAVRNYIATVISDIGKLTDTVHIVYEAGYPPRVYSLLGPEGKIRESFLLSTCLRSATT